MTPIHTNPSPVFSASKKVITKLATALVSVIFAFSLFACVEQKPSAKTEPEQSQQQSQQQAKNIVVSIRPYALILSSFESGLEKQQHNIHVLLEAGATPHDFQLRPSHLKKIAQADVIVWSGEQSEPFLAKALKNTTLKANAKIVNVTELENLKRIKWNTSTHHKSHDRAVHNTDNEDNYVAHDSNSVSEFDSHIWLSEHNAKLIAKALISALAYPQSYLAIFNEKFTLDEDKSLEINNSALMVYHNAYAYLEKEIGVEHQFVIRESHNAQPSLRHWQKFSEKLDEYQTQKRALCIVTSPGYELSSEAKQVKKLLSKAQLLENTKIVEIDPLASSVEYKDFFSFWFDSKSRLQNCLALKP